MDSEGKVVTDIISDSKDGTITFAGVDESNWQAMDAISKEGSITATPMWSDNDLTLNYDPDGGIYRYSVCISTTQNSTYDLSKNDTSFFSEAKRQGYTFAGWYMDDTQITCFADIPREKWNRDQNYDFKARWTAVDPPDYTIDSATGTLTIISENGFPSLEYGEYAKRVVINEGITEISARVFEGFDMEEIALPSTIKTIGNAAFYNCSSLKSITIPDGVTEIPYRCFFNNYALEEVVLPDSVVSIGEDAFCNATIKEVTFASTQEQWAALCEQAEELKTATVTYVEPVAPHVHDAKLVPEVAAACETTGVKAYYTCDCGTYFEDKDFQTIISDLTAWKTGAGLLDKKGHSLAKTDAKAATCTAAGNKEYWTCSVCGKIYSDAEGKTETTAAAITVAATGVPKAGTEITDTDGTACYEVTGSDAKNPTVAYTENKNSNASTVSIPPTVTIEGVTYKVTEIADNASKDNKKITQVTISKNVTTVGQNAFYGCTKLKTVTVGSNVTTIGADAFKNCKALTKITLPSKTTKIGANAFKGCSKLKTITIQSKKMTSKTISKNAFKGVSSKATIKVPKGKAKSYKTLFRKKGLSKKVKVK